MSNEQYLMLAVFLIGSGTLFGFFKTKKPGFGRFATSTVLILMVVVVASLMFSAGKLDSQIMANVLFAVIGFAGGLFTGREKVTNRQDA